MKKTDDVAKKLIEKPLDEKKSINHQLYHKKTLPIPTTTSSTKKDLNKTKIVLQKSSKYPEEQLYCSHNQKYPLSFIEPLKHRKVQSISAKEKWIAMSSLRKLSIEMQQWMCWQISREIKVVKKEPLEFYSLVERREERHFQIDRTIKFLSDS